MTSSPSRPAVAAVRLGYLATVPFIAGAGLVWIVDAPLREPVALALSAYAAVVVAFIGAIHWGLAFSQTHPATRTFVWGVVPSIVAWGAVLLPARSGLALHVVMLVICYLVDRARYPQLGVAAWLPLRLQLTGVAVICCSIAALRA